MGQDKTDLSGFIQLCPEETPEFSFVVKKQLGGSSSTEEIASAKWNSLTQKSPSQSNFETEASAVLGSWYDDLPETAEDPAKENFRKVFRRVKDSG